MSVLHQPGPEGWRPDPYGRHEVRFFDGHRWTPYVRDGDANAFDEPVGVSVDNPVEVARGGVLAEPVLLVEHHVDHGRRLSDRAVRRGDGRQVGVLRTAAPADRPSSLRSRMTRDQFKGDAIELVDDHDHVVLSLHRPIGAARTTLVVRDAAAREAGRIAQQTVRGGATTFALLAPGSAFLGDLQAESWTAWDFRVVGSHGRGVATINRDRDGLAPAAVSSAGPDGYVVRIDQPVPEPLRTLVVAAALGVEVALNPEAR